MHFEMDCHMKACACKHRGHATIETLQCQSVFHSVNSVQNIQKKSKFLNKFSQLPVKDKRVAGCKAGGSGLC